MDVHRSAVVLPAHAGPVTIMLAPTSDSRGTLVLGYRRRLSALLTSTSLLCLVTLPALAETAPLRGPETLACNGDVVGESTIWDVGGGEVQVTVTFTSGPPNEYFYVDWVCSAAPGACHQDECGAAWIGQLWTDASGNGSMTVTLTNPYPGQAVHLHVVESFPPTLTDGAEAQGGGELRTYTATFDETPGNVTTNQAPDWTAWHPGDVHVHAAGDTHLGIHPQCGGDLFTDTLCAFTLVDNVLERAQRFGAEWLIFTEHAPWLGFRRDNDVELYDSAQGEAQWELIKHWLDTLSGSEIRGLMGSELGTAAPACTSVDADLGTEFVCRNIPLPPFVVCTFEPRVENVKLSSPGHYGVYSTPHFIDNSMVDCNETGENGYADDAWNVGAWGGINHPDNADGGSPWWCYASEVVGGDLQGREKQPQLGFRRLDRCPLGIDQYGVEAPSAWGSFRSMEIISGNNLPSAKTLGVWDMFLQNGFRVAAVGGGDGHTAPRKQDVGGALACLAKYHPLYPGGPPTVGECVDAGSAPGDPNHNKAGGSGRTLAHYPDIAVGGSSYDSSNPSDPARLAIRHGRTVATNGPTATAQVKGGQPGATVAVGDDAPFQLRIDWRGSWTAVGDTIDGEDFSKSDPDDFDDIPGPSEKMHTFSNEEPDRIVVVTGLTDGCGWNRFHCAGAVERKVIDIVDGETDADGVTLFASDHIADVEMEPLGEDGYVRVELYWDVADDGTNELDDHHDTDDDDRPRYHGNRLYDFGAYTSPIYVVGSKTIEILGTLVDGLTGDPAVGAWVELCRTDNPSTCVTTTTDGDGAFGTISGAMGSWWVRAFPPTGMTGRGVATQSLGVVQGGTTRTVDLILPAFVPTFIDPAGTVLDVAGNPIEGAEVVLWHSENMAGPYEQIPDGDGRMSPGNRTNPGITGPEGTFAWDVLAGWYKVTATKAGCLTPAGEDAADTGPLQVPPPVLGLKLVLDCRPDDTTPPVITITGGPTGPTTETSVSYGVSVVDDDPGAAAFCLVDDAIVTDEEGGLPDELPACSDPFVIDDLTDGPHRLSVAAIDTRANLATDMREFTVLGQGLRGSKLILKTSAGTPAKATISGKALDPALDLRRGNGSADDPSLHGGSLRVRAISGAAFDKTYTLPASAWRRLSTTPNRGYTYKDSKALNGPVKKLLIKPGPKGAKLTFVAKGAIPVALGDDPERVRIELRLGARLYCLEYGEGASWKPGKSWLAKEAAAPECP